MLDTIQTELNQGVKKMAESSLIKKLNEQGINRNDLTSDKFEELLLLEIEIIKNDGKKVGAGIAVGIGISLLTGGLF
ncbi:hypothetical protein N5T82_10745 [Aliarcobacter cryaerophilus]|jgi:hypothetical protein|uniref:hypothetical protein n=1 Tax=Aliarcobacter cryaerophilus TaxID=28198 RepID=UPI0021B4A375|nr:hypothetical protein [Aliarcobacter cryaerophilus]MCT7433718.1 hypothetical protein [Aliarcobacter cryaerophilus]MCT7521119.1 hypothetical protein [Aliarcobacter cryaerophilus]MCT7540321.1 hypothetical protein [Aliarcobacter cryaerophilus]